MKRGRKIGFKLSLESRKKLSETHKRIGTIPPSQLGKIGYWKGKIRPEISKAHKGIKLTLDVKEKISKTLLGRKLSEEHKEKIGNGNRGKKVSLETRLKISIANNRGLTSLNERIRKSVEYRLWRESVFERDNYTCQFCKKKGGNLNADHIKPFSLYLKLRFELDNGRTLCIPCHRTTDTWGMRGKQNI